MVLPGEYSVAMNLVNNGNHRLLSEPQSFRVKPLYSGALEGSPGKDIQAFREEYEMLRERYSELSVRIRHMDKRLTAMKSAVLKTEKESGSLIGRIQEAEKQLDELKNKIYGSPSRDQVGEKKKTLAGSRLNVAGYGLRSSYGPTATHRASLELAGKEINAMQELSDQLYLEVMPSLEDALKKAGSPGIEEH